MSVVRCLVWIVPATLAVAGCTPRSTEPSSPHVPAHFSARPDAAYRQFLDHVAAEPGAVRTRSGMVYRELSPGSGAAPRASDTVTVRYQVKLPDGRVVTDSASHGGAVVLLVDQVQPCMREALLRMRAGGVSRFVCPPSDDDPNRTPTAVETTLVAVGQPLPPRGH